jgi:hypothetical protein
MSDYFDNLLLRSFRPLLPAGSIDASHVAPPLPMTSAFAPAASHEFEDPFAQGDDASNDQTADDPQPPTLSSRHSMKRDTKRRLPIAVNPSASEAQHNAADSGPGELASSDSPTKPALPREQKTTPLRFDPRSAPDRTPAFNAGPPTAVAKQEPAVDGALESNKPPMLSRDTSRSQVRQTPGRESVEIGPPSQVDLPLGQSVVPPATTLTPIRRSSPPSTSDLSADPALPTQSSSKERVSLRPVGEAIDKRDPAPNRLVTLTPRPNADLKLPAINNRRAGLSAQREENAAGPEISASETIVNVSIGRIEVRAVPPKAVSPERARNTPHIMNLDEYLRQRLGGGR